MGDDPKRFGFEPFDCAPALRIDANERIAALQFKQIDARLLKIETAMERLEKRLWVTLYGVIAIVLTQAATSLLPVAA